MFITKFEGAGRGIANLISDAHFSFVQLGDGG